MTRIKKSILILNVLPRNFSARRLWPFKSVIVLMILARAMAIAPASILLAFCEAWSSYSHPWRDLSTQPQDLIGIGVPLYDVWFRCFFLLKVNKTVEFHITDVVLFFQECSISSSIFQDGKCNRKNFNFNRISNWNFPVWLWIKRQKFFPWFFWISFQCGGNSFRRKTFNLRSYMILLMT